MRYLVGSSSVKGFVIITPPSAMGSGLVPSGSDIFVEQYGFVRSSDGVLLRSEKRFTFDNQSDISNDGTALHQGADVVPLSTTSSWGGTGGAVFGALSVDSRSLITETGGSDGGRSLVKLLFAADQPEITREVFYPTGFTGDLARRIGDTSKFVVIGHEDVSGTQTVASVVIDIDAQKLLDHRVTTYPYDSNYGAAHTLAAEGSHGFVFGANQVVTTDPTRFVEVPLNASYHTTAPVPLTDNPKIAEMLSAGVSDAGLLASGTQHYALSMSLINGDTGTLARKILRQPIIDNFAWTPFVVSPSGRFLFYEDYGTDGVGRFAAASTASGTLSNSSDQILPGPFFPLSDDSVLGYFTISSVYQGDAKLTRAAGGFNLAKTYTDANGSSYGPVIGSSSDGRTFLAEDSVLRLMDGVSGKSLATTLWDYVTPSDDNIQAAMDGEGYIVIVKKTIDDSANRVILEIRRYARQEGNLASLGSVVRRSYIHNKTISGAQVPYESPFPSLA